MAGAPPRSPRRAAAEPESARSAGDFAAEIGRMVRLGRAKRGIRLVLTATFAASLSVMASAQEPIKIGFISTFHMTRSPMRNGGWID